MLSWKTSLHGRALCVPAPRSSAHPSSPSTAAALAHGPAHTHIQPPRMHTRTRRGFQLPRTQFHCARAFTRSPTAPRTCTFSPRVCTLAHAVASSSCAHTSGSRPWTGVALSGVNVILYISCKYTCAVSLIACLSTTLTRVSHGLMSSKYHTRTSLDRSGLVCQKNRS